MDDKTTSRRRGAKLGLLMVLLVALASAGYAVSSSPSASTGANGKISSAQVLAPAANAGNNGNGTGNGNGSSPNCLDPSSENGNCIHPLVVDVGQVDALYPGVGQPLPVTFTNPYNFDIYITSYRVSRTSLKTGCPATDLQIPTTTYTPSPKLTVAKNGFITEYVQIKLSADAVEACQLANFSITVNASAVKK
jgi:hypothetical protein